MNKRIFKTVSGMRKMYFRLSGELDESAAVLQMSKDIILYTKFNGLLRIMGAIRHDRELSKWFLALYERCHRLLDKPAA